MYAAIEFPGFTPEIFTISLFGISFSLRWYAMAYLVGILLGWRIVIALMKRPRLWPGATPPLTREQIEDLLTVIVLGIIVGGRLGFVLFYEPAKYLANPIDIVKIWEGGMSFHGGFLGVGDALAVATPLGLFLGRVANFINAELWGRPTTLPWGVIFPGQAAQDCPGIVGPCARHPSQLYEAGLEGILLGLALIVLLAGCGSSAQLQSGMFLLGYGLSRFLVEFVRQPDAQFVTPDNPIGFAIGSGSFGLTMGQLLSLPMILVGLWLIARARAS